MDPLNDPRFPDRPQHKDFWRMSEILNQNDGDVTEGGKSIPEVFGVDSDSLMYVANQRLGMAVQVTGGKITQITLLGIFLDAFTLGKKFGERGKTDDTTSVLKAAQAAQDAANGDSNDTEIELLRDALEEALGLLGLDLPEGRE